MTSSRVRRSPVPAQNQRPEFTRISAKTVGAFALPDPCLRCLWHKLHLRFALPWQMMPGIFSVFDVHVKRLVHGYIDSYGRVPPWLADLGEIVGYVEPPHYSKFWMADGGRAVVLTGMVDALLVRNDGRFVIADYKVARYTPAQDELLPLYVAQLNGYGRIAESRGLAPVAALALVYLEPQAAATNAGANGYREYGFDLPFVAHVVPVPLDPGLVDPLLDRVCELRDRPSPPAGKPGCRDCTAVAALAAAEMGT